MRLTASVHGRPAWLLSALMVLACRGNAARPPALSLTTLRDVEAFAAQPGTSGERTADVRGVVTYFDAERGRLYLQDDTAAAAVDVGELEAPVVAGARVSLSGPIVPGAAPLRLRHPQLTVQGLDGPELMPPPQALDAAALLGRDGEAAWVEVHGRVLATQNRGRLLSMDLEDAGRRFRALILNLDQSRYPLLAGCRVRLHGVHAVRDAGPEAAQLLVPDVGYMRIVEEAAADEPDASLPLLITAAAVRRLSTTEAARGYPVRFQGVVTYSNPEMRLLFVQDATAGIYVEAWRHLHDARAGDRVEVSGRSSPGLFAPIVDRPRLRRLGRGALPEPARVRPQALVHGRYDSQWVEIEGVVHTVAFRRPGVVIGMDIEGVPISVEIPEPGDAGLRARLVDARARVRGVCRSILTLKNQLAGAALDSPSLDALEVLSAPPAEPGALPVRSIRSLFQFADGESWEQRVRVRGVVAYSRAGQLYVRDETGGVLVLAPAQRPCTSLPEGECKQVQTGPEPPPPVGREVDVIGFAAPGEYSPVLQDAATRTIGTAAVAPPTAVTAEEAQSGQYDGELVRIEARLLDRVSTAREQQLSLQSGPYLFTASLPDAPPLSVRVGSRLRLSGICAVSTDEQRRPRSFRILLRAPDDVEVVHAASWWTPRRAAGGAGVLAAVAALAIAWGVTLRRRVAAQASIIWTRVKRETELQERQRIARELHDSLEQNLTGASLSLGAARILASKAMQEHLTLAIEQVRASITEVHRAVWALREELVDARGLPAAVGDIAQQLASCSDVPIEVRTEVVGAPYPFAVAVENDLLRIGQEALTNAVKHGGATRIEVEFRYDTEAFSLRVRDDGRGFDAAAPRPEGHFGLIGMEERAHQIGARLEIRSASGRGTDVVVVVPVQPLSLPAEGLRSA
jgi:signal transduction histidine kinase